MKDSLVLKGLKRLLTELENLTPLHSTLFNIKYLCRKSALFVRDLD